jgi:protein-S-isoprenylcysteine O-methyltransferase Ste14
LGLALKAFAGLAWLAVAMAAMIFVPAATLRYPEAWAFLAVFVGCALAITLYLMARDPKLLERRVRAGPVAEQRPGQKLIQAAASFCFLATMAVPGLDRRYGWSHVPLPLVVAGDALVALGFWLVFRVFRENTYTSSVIEVAGGQTVVDTGPYALVRHPMYAGALVLLLGVPLALGSWWGLCTLAPMTAVIVVRLLDEEKFLAANLQGYAQYREKVRHRLIPRVW